jgi:hypothetical protein
VTLSVTVPSAAALGDPEGHFTTVLQHCPRAHGATRVQCKAPPAHLCQPFCAACAVLMIDTAGGLKSVVPD